MKKFILLLVVLVGVTLSSCNTTSKYQSVLDKVRDDLEITSTIEAIQLPNVIDEVEIEWESNIDNTISNSNKVIQKDIDVDAIFTAYLSYDGRVLTKQFHVTILKNNIASDYTGYYSGANNLTGEALKTFLHYLIDEHIELSYGDLRNALQHTDEDPNNADNIILLYTGRSIDSKWDYGTSWNREHVWPRSLGGMNETDAEHNDLHHVRPTDPGVNSIRSNKEFDEGGTLVNGTTDCYSDSDSFEPRDEVKGDIARMLFYMAVRYEGTDGEIDLEIIDQIDGSSPTIGLLNILLKWHEEDPVDDFERNRNDIIFTYQGNRNPFIDHPEFARLIWGY